MRLKAIATLCALVPGGVSLGVTLMWLTEWQAAAALWPPLLDMKANMAAGFTLCAVALLLFVHDRSRSATVLAAVALLVGIVTLWEHASGGTADIDELLVHDWSGVGVPGRPAPNSAANLMLFGATFLAMGLMRGGGRQDMVVKLLCFLVIAVAAEAIAGHLVGSPYAIGWGSRQSMSSLGAWCCITLAIGTLAQCLRAEMSLFDQASLWIPVLLAIGIGLLDLYTPLDYQVGLGYILLVACGAWFPRTYYLTIFTVVAIALVVFGLFAAPQGAIQGWAAIVNRALAIGAILLVAALVRVRLRRQDSLRQMVQHLESIQQLTATGSFELDLATMTFTTTRGFDAIHGLRPRALRDWPMFVEAMIPADDHPAVAHFIAAARRGDCTPTLDYGFLRPDGETGEAELRCIPTLDERGVPIAITGIVHDVTTQRQRERQQQELEAKLRHAQKLESLGMLAGGIAHDLNNILVPVTMLAPLLLDTVENPSDRQSVQLIMGSARRAKELVREMLVYTRKDPPSFEPVRLDELVQEALTILRAGIPADIAIVEELEHVPEIRGSKGQLYQVVLNLATNAAQAIGQRAGTITIGTRSEPSAQPSGHDVRLFVRDDGEGMDSATLERVFEPFFSTKDGLRGTGIGLSIAYGIVKNHGGSISAQSRRGHGARFDVLFPAAQRGEDQCLAA